MPFVRTIFAVLISVAVAILPAAGAAAFKLPDAGMTDMSAAEPMHNCCPDEDNPCDKSAHDCKFMAMCVLKCLNFWAASFSYVALPKTDKAAISLPVNAALHAHAVGPPFRPPRS